MIYLLLSLVILFNFIYLKYCLELFIDHKDGQIIIWYTNKEGNRKFIKLTGSLK
jgi:hypothetical protein